MNLPQMNPLLNFPRESRKERARPLLEFIEELERSNKSG